MGAWIRAIAAAMALLLWSAPLAADSWLPPGTKTYFSANRQFRLKVHPRPEADAYAHFLAEACGRRPPGARAMMAKRKPGGGWQQVWAGPLVNPAPAGALVSNDGRYAITLDNWYSTGMGTDVVVIYGAQGRLIRSLALADFLPEDYVRALPRTFSSLLWSWNSEVTSDGRRLILGIIGPSSDSFEAPGIDLEVDLATGRPIPPTGPDWDAALAAAARVAAESRAREAATEARFAAPLLGPGTSNEDGWYIYLNEAFSRIAPDQAVDRMRTIVLRSPDAPTYRLSLDSLRWNLRNGPNQGETRLLGSSSQEHLAKVVEEEARSAPAGALKGVRLYVAVGDAQRERVAAALAHTGAELIQIDPSKPIPQRPERLRARNADMSAEEMCGPMAR